METPWERARKLRSTAQEAHIGKMPHGTTQPNSGRIWRWKRDGKLWNFLVEARTNENPNVKSYRIQSEEWIKLRREAISTPPGLRPSMQINIGNLSLFVLELADWETVYTRLIELEARAENEQEDSG